MNSKYNMKFVYEQVNPTMKLVIPFDSSERNIDEIVEYLIDREVIDVDVVYGYALDDDYPDTFIQFMNEHCYDINKEV